MNEPRKGSPLARRARILIVDDHPTMREGLAARIGRQPDMEVCGESDCQRDALQKIASLRPDLVIVDISLKDGHGVNLIKGARDRGEKVKFLVHSMYAESLYALRSLQAGAQGYVCKEADPDVLLDAIRQVLKGDVYVSPAMSQQILGRLAKAAAAPLPKDPAECLSNREMEVLTLIGQGKTTREIAEQLHLSIHTIESYREKLRAKLGLANGAQLTRFAAQWVLENA
jgi:DNA-binding NarL/FixJ family response regulator